MDWTGKTATAQVIRGFVRSTPVVESCALPLCISRLVIAPKYGPGQMKDDPDHGFRVCVNALINKCLKPYASTLPLATDEIKKLRGYKYFLQVDGFSAYWSIPVCEESKRLKAFHTPDGIHCWNRLMMGATPSSAVQRTVYLEALHRYIDVDENDNIRKCLLDENGVRLKDAEGSPKTLRHRFAIYCDDISAGADTLEELYELLEALICCCYRAGIQVKAAKINQVWCMGGGFPQLHHIQRRYGAKSCKYLRFCKHGRTERHASSESVLRMLSAVEPVYKRLRNHCQTVAQHHQERGQRSATLG
jgi:hypothetical protein